MKVDLNPPKIGFMQGRFSPLENNRIQSFPWGNWAQEFELARESDFGLMEWTLDQDRLHQNPLLNVEGQSQIRKLCSTYEVKVSSVTGDCFMQAPFWRESGIAAKSLEKDFIAIINACALLQVEFIVVPLVDGGALETLEQENRLIEFLKSQSNLLNQDNVKIVFESDFEPANLKRFIDRLDPFLFGINYDIGNSAALGFNAAEEFAAYGNRVKNVHIKDRVLKGTTVPLGSGNANFELVFEQLKKMNYKGNYILQTARAQDGDHAAALKKYQQMAIQWLNKFGLDS